MRSTCIGTLCLAVACLSWAVSAPALGGDPHDHVHAAVGKPAPQFTLTDTTGGKHSLTDVLKSENVKVVVLEWFNHECPVCAQHATEKTMINLVNTYKDKGVAVFGIDSSYGHMGKESDINAKIKEWGVNYPVLKDFEGKIGHLYGATNTPHMFVITEDGNLVYSGAIDNRKQGDDRINYVDAALEQVLAGETVAKSRTEPYGCTVKYKKG